MMRQYFAQRSMGGDNPLRVGVIAIGAIYARRYLPITIGGSAGSSRAS